MSSGLLVNLERLAHIGPELPKLLLSSATDELSKLYPWGFIIALP